jgi:hypothetical protein
VYFQQCLEEKEVKNKTKSNYILKKNNIIVQNFMRLFEYNIFVHLWTFIYIFVEI